MIPSHQHPHPAIREAHEMMETLAEQSGADLLTCERCGGQMVVRNAQATDEPVKLDIRIKCPSDVGCGWWTRHGVGKPFAREDHERWQDRWGGHVDAVNTEAPESSVEERLEHLGYGEF